MRYDLPASEPTEITVTMTTQQADDLSALAWAAMTGEPVPRQLSDEAASEAFHALWQPLRKARAVVAA